MFVDPRATVLLLSDLHFGDGSRTDLFLGQDAFFLDYIDTVRREYDVIVFLGDILDLPQAWTVRRIARAHPALFRALDELSGAMDVYFIRGNHDWTVDYSALFPRAHFGDSISLGEDTLIWHGHQLDRLMHPGNRGALAKTFVHSFAERLAGERLIPPLERYDSRANRIALKLAVRFARIQLAQARLWRRLGRDAKAGDLEESVRYLARSVTGDPADIYGATRRDVLGKDGIETVVCGHSHLPGVATTSEGTFVNTGTWTCGMRTCAQWDGERFAVLDIGSGEEIGDENYRDIAEATTPTDLFAWADASFGR